MRSTRWPSGTRPFSASLSFASVPLPVSNRITCLPVLTSTGTNGCSKLARDRCCCSSPALRLRRASSRRREPAEPVARGEAVEHGHHLEVAELEAIERRPQRALHVSGHGILRSRLWIVICRTQITRTTEARASPCLSTAATLYRGEEIADRCGGDEPHRRQAAPPCWRAGRCASPSCRARGLSRRAPPRRRSPPSGTDSRSRIALPSPSCALALRTRLFAAVLDVRVGDADQREIAGVLSARRRGRRLEIALAVNAQQRQRIRAIDRDALGIAEPGDGDDVAALGEPAVGDDMAVGADDQAGAVIDRFGRATRSARCPPGNGAKALAIAAVTGATMPSIAWS